jgi:cold shock CspA family protein
MVGPVPSSRRPFSGRVTSFDARRGWGTVTDAAGTVLDFHATAILDGSRRIEPGTEVSFVVVPGHRGRYEATGLSGLSPYTRAPSREVRSEAPWPTR